jgi:hypothetical protein
MRNKTFNIQLAGGFLAGGHPWVLGAMWILFTKINITMRGDFYILFFIHILI